MVQTSGKTHDEFLFLSFPVILVKEVGYASKKQVEKDKGVCPFFLPLFTLPAAAWYDLTRNIFAPGDFLSLPFPLLVLALNSFHFFWLLSLSSFIRDLQVAISTLCRV
jgi:hypothetical protein